jgi:hypothetical protein
MAKPLQQDSEGNIINDTVTQENQKGYANYEANLKKQQEEMREKDKTDNKYMNLLRSGMDMLSRPVVKKAKGGSVKSASSRADGCAVRGKTRA